MVAILTIFSMITATSVGFANPVDSSNSKHTHKEVDHHHHEDDHDHHHHNESAKEAQEVIAAPFVEDEQEEHTHKHQHGPNTPPHEHSHNHSHSHGHSAPSSLAWVAPNQIDIKTVSKESEKCTPSQDERPEDPYLASIFRPPIFLS